MNSRRLMPIMRRREFMPGVADAQRAAGPEFDVEMRLSREYLLATSEGLGIAWV